ncbi:hypothetical protein FIM08_03255 [SAR202 cluster bacterium AC-647-N09_OGT_505m]|nr:hypothetical protein [SAR202 cluster bacterium AC-647-N09_OGT_505m]
MPTWEYKVIRLRSLSDQEEALNALGQYRWELISVATEVGELRAYLKRERVDSTTTSEGAAGLSSTAPQDQGITTTIGDHITLRVSGADDPGVDGWVDTGLDLWEDCAGISISTDGTIQASTGEVVTTEGSAEHMAFNPAVGLELPAGCLVAKVGEQGTVEPVYFSGFLALEHKGRLYLAVSDESYQNNDGEFTVSVTVL